MKILLAAMVGLLLSGCTHSLHISHMSDFSPTYAPYQRGERIDAASEQFVIMGFVTQTDFVDEAFHKLEAKCQGGDIQGVQTQYSTDHGFFSWTNRIRMQALCLKKG